MRSATEPVTRARCASRRHSLGFGSLFSITVYALTPAVLADAALSFVGASRLLILLLYLTLAIFYTATAARSVSDQA